MRQQRRYGLPKAVRQEERRTVGRSHLGDLMHDALRHGQRACADVDHDQQLTLGVHGRAHPLGRPFQALDGLGLAHLPILHGTEEGKQLIELDLIDANIVEKMA